MKLWLSRQRNGLYMLTRKLPVLARVGGGGDAPEDLYIEPGDPVGFRNICEWFVGTQGILPLAPLESIEVDVTVTPLAPGGD